MYRERKSRGVVRLTGGALAPYPVGAVYQSVDPTDPGTIFGGTWIRLKGKVLVGLDEADPSFDTVLETGGEKTHVLTEAEMADHYHGAGDMSANVTGSSHDHAAGTYVVSMRSAAGSAAGLARGNSTIIGDAAVNGTSGTSGSGHTHDVEGNTGTGSGQNQAHNNLQPYTVVYMWRRTA